MHVKYDPQAVKTLMTRKGLSARDVASRSRGKIGHSSVSRLASGEYEKAQENKLKALASALGVAMEDLLED